MPEFITRMGYHFRQKILKIGVKLAEIGGIHKHVIGKMADVVPSAENRQKMSQK